MTETRSLLTASTAAIAENLLMYTHQELVIDKTCDVKKLAKTYLRIPGQMVQDNVSVKQPRQSCHVWNVNNEGSPGAKRRKDRLAHFNALIFGQVLKYIESYDQIKLIDMGIQELASILKNNANVRRDNLPAFRNLHFRKVHTCQIEVSRLPKGQQRMAKSTSNVKNSCDLSLGSQGFDNGGVFSSMLYRLLRCSILSY